MRFLLILDLTDSGTQKNKEYKTPTINSLTVQKRQADIRTMKGFTQKVVRYPLIFFIWASVLTLNWTSEIRAEVVSRYECRPNQFIKVTPNDTRNFLPPSTFWIERDYLHIEFSGSVVKFFNQSRRKHRVMGSQWFATDDFGSKIEYRDGLFSWLLTDEKGVQVLIASCEVTGS